MLQSDVLAIVYNFFGPYQLARLAATTQLAKKNGWRVVGIEYASRWLFHPWERKPLPPELELHTLFPHKAIHEVGRVDLFRGMWSRLHDLQPIALALSHVKCPAMIAAMAWGRLKKRIIVNLADSKHDDSPRYYAKEWLKRQVYGRVFDAALVSGTLSKDYIHHLGIPLQKIFRGCDVVDNRYFSRQAEWARENADRLREQYRLPKNYFLAVSGFIEKKNISRLLQAYAQYADKLRENAWALVICGSGLLESRLKEEARQLSLQQVHFTGYQQIDTLPFYYGLSRVFIIPSSHSEQWGLVVNEAMASGLPVLVSKACGCAPDLVQDGVNGFTFDPRDVEGLVRLMLKISSGAVDLGAMGEASRKVIAGWSLETYAQNLFKAVEAGLTRK